MKRLIALLMAVLMLSGTLALAQEDAPGPLTLTEIEQFNQAILARAAADEPTVRPLGDGFIAMGKGYELTLSSEDISEDSVVLGAAITLEGSGQKDLADPRGLAIDATAEELMAKYPNDNPYLAGSPDGAVLYIAGELPAAVYTGFVVRDGQAISLIEYNVYHQVDGGVARAGLQYTIAEGKVRAIRSFITQEALSQVEAQQAITRLSELQEENSVVSNAGAPGTPLEREDMEIGSLDFFDLTPEAAKAALGEPESEGKAASAQGELLTLQWPGVEAVFSLDKDGKLLKAERVTVNEGALTGPRGLRLGNPLAQAISLFAHGSELPEEGGFLYGKDQTAPYGSLVVGSEYTTLYYVIDSPNGNAGLIPQIGRAHV